VRRTLSYSLHEVAAILGSDLAHEELMPILGKFLHDSTEVRDGVLRHFPEFIKVLDEEKRGDCLELIVEI
jgi:serine/threonine-protein phosphatase 4 regulatory subunit 1